MQLHHLVSARPVRLAVGVATVAAIALTAPVAQASTVYSVGDVVTVDGVSVTAPAPGNSVSLSVTRIDAPSTTLVVTTDADGNVTVGDGLDVVDDTAAGTTGDLAPNKCNDGAYSLIDGSKWQSTYNWAFRSKTTPGSMTKAQAAAQLKKAVNNITDSSNKCGLKDQVGVKNQYKGSTSQASDVTSQPACKASPGSVNVTEFGPIGGGGILAATCTYTNGTKISAADVRINTQFQWWEGSGGCSGAYGLQGVQTHEYGHAFGLGHVEEGAHGNLTMSTNINAPCSNFEASLGKGDVNALRKLY